MPAPPNAYVPIATAAREGRITYRHLRRLIAEGKVDGIRVEGIPGDARVQWLVSPTSLAAHQRRVKTRGQ